MVEIPPIANDDFRHSTARTNALETSQNQAGMVVMSVKPEVPAGYYLGALHGKHHERERIKEWATKVERLVDRKGTDDFDHGYRTAFTHLLEYLNGNQS
jgi:hypothetical protein